ncbi:MAG: hypothetical protein DI551_07260, partial [Micavibrio aeruginosavorus]
MTFKQLLNKYGPQPPSIVSRLLLDDIHLVPSAKVRSFVDKYCTYLEDNLMAGKMHNATYVERVQSLLEILPERMKEPLLERAFIFFDNAYMQKKMSAQLYFRDVILLAKNLQGNERKIRADSIWKDLEHAFAKKDLRVGSLLNFMIATSAIYQGADRDKAFTEVLQRAQSFNSDKKLALRKASHYAYLIARNADSAEVLQAAHNFGLALT